MNYYRRYFEIKQGDLIDLIIKSRAINAEADKAYTKILKEAGFAGGYCHRGGKLVGILFDKPPSWSQFKPVRGTNNKGWYPKQKGEGRALHKALKAVVTSDVNICLSEFGLDPRIPYIFDFANGVTLYVTMVVIPCDPPTAYVTVPWYDKDPAEVEAYKKDKTSGDVNLDAICWSPPTGWSEVKEWEMSKAIDGWNDAVKEKQGRKK